MVFICRCEHSARDGVHLLQRYSKEWSQFADVTDIIEIESGDHLKVVPIPAIKKPAVYLIIHKLL